MSRPLGLSKICIVEDCDRKAIARHICLMHYKRARKANKLDDYPLLDRPRGTDHLGYVRRHINGRRIFEHRLVMEEFLGRTLEAHEDIHHINGVRDDNRLENLEIWSTSQPRGQRIPDKVAWTKEILALYGEDFDESN